MAPRKMFGKSLKLGILASCALGMCFSARAMVFEIFVGGFSFKEMIVNERLEVQTAFAKISTAPSCSS